MASTRRPQPPAAATPVKPASPGPASSLEDLPQPPRPDDAVEVARVVGAWGVLGGIKVKPLSADPQALFSSRRWWIEPGLQVRPGPVAGRPRELPRLLRIVKAREQGDAVVATAQELPDRDAAEALKGARIFVSRGSFPTPAEGEYYWVDLIGLQVRNRQGQVLGEVDHLIETGPHCVLVVTRSQAQGVGAAASTMIPFVDAYVDRVDRDARMIEVDWDPGS